jgi:hypothetical protein
MPKKLFDVDPPEPVIVYGLGAVPITGEPDPALGAVRERKANRVGLVLLSRYPRANKCSQIRGRGCFAGC